MAAAKAPHVRAFVALDLDTTGLRRMVRLSDRLRMSSGAPSATWEPAGKLHVTLKFAGELPASAIEPLGKALRPLAEGKAAPPACLLKLDAFPSAARAEVVIAELLDDKGVLGKLAQRVEKLTSRYGVPVDKRAYRPHVTLARLRLPYDARKWLRPELAEVAGDCRAGSLTLYRSHLGEGGSRYEVIARWGFEGGLQGA